MYVTMKIRNIGRIVPTGNLSHASIIVPVFRIPLKLVNQTGRTAINVASCQGLKTFTIHAE